jgi:hypothetical protein
VRPSPSSELLNGPLLKLRFRFLGFYNGSLLPNFNKIVECELLMMGVQQLEDVFSIVRTNLRAWLSMLDLGANGVSTERLKETT